MSRSLAFVRWTLVAALAMSIETWPAAAAPNQRHGRFVRVYDSANIVVKRVGGQSTFSLLGVRPIVEAGSSRAVALEARRFLDTRLRGERLTLVPDESAPRARGGRDIPGYVYLEDGTCLNELILAMGYGAIDDGQPFERLDDFRAMEWQAQANGFGRWAALLSPACWDAEAPCPDGTVRYLGDCGLTRPQVIPETRVTPEYPRKAKRKWAEGRVVLQAGIAADGSVAWAVPVLSPDDRLSAAAADAVARWRFRPALKEGRPVDVDLTVVVEFVLLGL